MPFEETEEGGLRIGPVKPDDEKLGWRWWLGILALCLVSAGSAVAFKFYAPLSDWQRLDALEARVSALEEADR